MNTNTDFEIEKGKLKKYLGNDSEVTIPNTVTSIGYYAFSGCTSLTSITIPDTVTSIGGNAFSGCTSLTSITIPDSVTSIGDAAFWNCTNLTSITIPDSVTSIGGSAFWNCTSLTSITIPDSVTRIRDAALKDCHNLTKIICSPTIEKQLGDDDLKQKTLSRFLVALTSNTATEQEKQDWFAFISENSAITLKTLKDNPTLYSLVTENRWLPLESVDEILASTESLECRALLLEYKKEQPDE